MDIKKINIRFNAAPAVPIDKLFLDVLALKHFKKPYEDKEIKKAINRMLRELIGDEYPHPQKVEQKILLDVVPKWISKELKNTGKNR